MTNIEKIKDGNGWGRRLGFLAAKNGLPQPKLICYDGETADPFSPGNCRNGCKILSKYPARKNLLVQWGDKKGYLKFLHAQFLSAAGLWGKEHQISWLPKIF